MSVTYSFVVTNTGNVDLTGIAVTDTTFTGDGYAAGDFVSGHDACSRCDHDMYRDVHRDPGGCERRCGEQHRRCHGYSAHGARGQLAAGYGGCDHSGRPGVDIGEVGGSDVGGGRRGRW